jgi:ribokinase
MSEAFVLVVGSINVDLVVHAERLPAAGETVAGGRLERSGGGKGANQAVAAARAGAAVAMVGAVGDDDLGAGAIAELEREGIDVSGLHVLAGVATGVALIVVDAAGDNQIAVASGANHALLAEHVRTDAAPDCVLASFELRDEPVLAAARLARDAGCPLVVNPAPARTPVDGLCALAPLLTPNRSEAERITGERDPETAARALAARTGAPVVVTLGEQGALLHADGASEVVAAPAVRAVDTTGAGDSFNGVLAAGLARGAALRDATVDAVAAASRSVTRPGARG